MNKMFRKKPSKTELMDQLEVQIEEHSRISNRLDREYESSRADAEKNAKRGLMKAAKMAFQNMQFVKNKLESTEITRIRLRQIKTSLVALPDRIPDKTIQGVDRILRESRTILHSTQSVMDRVLDGETLSMELSMDDADSVTESSTEEFASFLNEIGLGASVQEEEPQPTVVTPPVSSPEIADLPSVPTDVPVEETEESDEEKDEKELTEEQR